MIELFKLEADVHRALRRSVCGQERRKQDPVVGPLRCGAVARFSLGAVRPLGIEKVRMVPGITATNSLDLYYMPYTHSLVGALIWSGLAFASTEWYRARRLHGSGVARGVCCLFPLDPGFDCSSSDLAIYDDTWKVGLGLWNYRGWEFVLEIAILLGGIVLYLKRNSVARTGGIVTFGVVLILIQAGNTFVHRPPSSDQAFAITR